MSASPSDHAGAPAEPLAVDAALHSLADGLLTSLVEDGIRPSLLHVADPLDPTEPDEAELGLLPLDDRHPTELLLGFTAPEHWRAVGMATGGWAYHVDDRAKPDRRRQRVHLVTLVARSGEIAHRVHVEGDDRVSAQLAATDTPVGEQIDLLRRVLGLATEAPPCEASIYWAIDWLSGLLATDADELSTWDDVCDRHAARRVLEHVDPTDGGRRDIAVTDFDLVLRAFGRVCDWPTLRRAASQDRFEAPELTATDAAWLDDGAFARFLLNRCPPLSMLRRQAIDHLPGHLAEKLVNTLGRAGIPQAAWPDRMAA